MEKTTTPIRLGGTSLGNSLLAILGISLLGWLSTASAVTLTAGTDTYVRGKSPDTAHGGALVAEWDASDSGRENHALIYFPIFQDEGGPVDPAVVTGNPDFRAFLRLEVVNGGDAGDLHRLTVAFDENSTWNSIGGGVLPGTNAEPVADAFTADLGVGEHEIEVTPSVEAWAATPGSNFGWGILPTGNDEVKFATFEDGNGPVLVLGVQEFYVDAGAAGAVWSFYDAILAGDPNYPLDGLGRFWTDPDYDDSSWPTGAGQFGYGDGDETTLVVGSHITYLFRTSFSAGDAPDDLVLDLLRDDSAIVYLNGVEVLRDNLPGGAIDASTPSSITGPENNRSTFYLDPLDLLPNATNTLAVEIHNASSASSDISFDMSLRGVEHISPVPVPEPHAALQLVVGAAFLALIRSRKVA
jgi:hypothetical protein